MALSALLASVMPDGIYLDNQHRLLEHETLFLGTINHTEIHPREIVKSAFTITNDEMIQ
jgi:DNA repair protein RadC